jgi:hypothetical protein
MALLMVELVRRDIEYGEFCHEEFFEGEAADKLRQSDYYATCLDFVRGMLRRRNERTARG